MTGTVALGDLYATSSPSVDPSKFLDEVFDLFSVPAYENRKPDRVAGSAIGSNKIAVEPGDVLICRIVPHIRRAWVVPAKGPHRQIASGEWIVLRDARMYPEYLRHLLLGDDFHRDFMRTVAGVGGSLLRARQANAASIRIPLPPLPEQRRIASILDEAELLRAAATRSIDGLNRLEGSIYSELFETPGADGRTFPESLLGTTGTLERGVSRARPRNRPDLLGGPHPLVQTGDIANADGYVSSHQQTYSDAGLAQSRMWPAGTLAITIAANIAKAAILTYPACFPDSVVGFTPKDGIQSEYVRFWLRGVQKTLELQAPSSAQKNINLEILRGLRIPIPPDSLQLHFVESIHRIEKLKEKARSRAAKLDESFASLQYRAFRGEL